MTDQSQNSSDGNRTDHVNWSVLVQRIQERMYLSQQDIAKRCGVARQTVSAWLHERRNPGLYAKRELMVLAAEAGVLDEVALPADSQEVLENRQDWEFQARRNISAQGVLPDARQLRLLLKQLSEQGREEVLEFARFKIFRERG